MDKQTQLEIYNVLRASKAFQNFDYKALHDFAENVILNLLPASESVDCEATERLAVVFKGGLVFAVKGTDTANEIIYELKPGDVIGTVPLLGGFRNPPQLQAACETTIIGIPWSIIDHHVEKSPEARKTLEDAIWHSSRRAQLAVHQYRFFGEINANALADFESMIEWQTLSPGAVLFHQGDWSDAVFFVVSGFLRVVLEENGQSEREINQIRAGETIGEIAYLTEARRSATVYAVRDSVLARLSYRSFDKLLDKYPNTLKYIARLVSKRLQRQAVRIEQDAQVTIIGVISSNTDCPLSEVTRHLVKALTLLGPTLHLDAGTVDRKFGRAIAQVSKDDPGSLRLAQWLHQQEGQYQYVVYEADRNWSSWTQRAIRHADQVVIFAAANSDPRPGAIEEKMDALWISGRAPQRSLVLVHPADTSEPQGTSRWLTPRNISGHYHVRVHAPADYARLARILAGRGIALVLGGGGARGFAHIGLVRSMEETGIPIDIVGGTSMGAILAGMIAMQSDAQKMHTTCKHYASDLFDYTLPVASLISGNKIRLSLESFCGKRRIEDLWLPFFCVATNMTQADQVVHRRGSLIEAIRSSMSLPGIMLPCYHDGDLLIDGGVVNNLPVDVMHSVFKGSKVIAVDVEPKKDLTVNKAFATEISGWALLLNRLNPFGKKAEIPSILNVLVRTATLASVYTRNKSLEKDPPDLYIRLPVETWGLLEFNAIDDIVARGYETSLPILKKWLPELNKYLNSSQ